MKTITHFLFALMVCLSTQLFAQNSRIFYQALTQSASSDDFTIASKNGVPYFVAVKENDGDFMKLAYGPIDVSTLSPLSYSYITLPINKTQFEI